ncbi:MAG: nicotinate (nicotinamide) nucleotide adenylyltransferase [Bacteroidales bacterium]|jgi:nicotinate-nucleotide adenylyltransferase|nr:nicotinate (nicotinamide) nucleotide adenylyltransferase [Bacteroidales bacterium]
MTLLFFGSFNPVHDGHILVARAALKKYANATVWFVLSAQNPFKKESDLWDYDKRKSLLEDKLHDEPRMKICTIEESLSKPSYTIDTLDAITKQYPTENFCLLMGQDNLDEIVLWKDYEKILEHFPIVVYPRNGGRTRCTDGAPELPAYSKITILDEKLLDYSSTEIRQR